MQQRWGFRMTTPLVPTLIDEQLAEVKAIRPILAAGHSALGKALQAQGFFLVADLPSQVHPEPRRRMLVVRGS